MLGSDGRYRSMVSGPIAISAPRVSTNFADGRSPTRSTIGAGIEPESGTGTEPETGAVIGGVPNPGSADSGRSDGGCSSEDASRRSQAVVIWLLPWGWWRSAAHSVRARRSDKPARRDVIPEPDKDQPNMG